MSNAFLKGMVKDALVQVDVLVFLANFYILNMEHDFSTNLTPIILGKPFLKDC